ncbi:MAG: hypothetical protein ACJ79E_03880 [Anaeromyxobacteraceae bacterium]
MPHAARTLRLAAALAVALGLAACGSAPAAKVTVPPPAARQISATSGGTATGDNGNVTVTIPAGALSGDADVSITEVASPPAAGASQTAASKAYAIKLIPAGVALSEPMTIAIAASAAPVHPQLGELATLSGTSWTRLAASFTRPPQTVLGLSTSADATYRVTFRTLRKVDPASPAAQRGFDVFMHETFGNETFFTSLGLAALLNNVSPADVVPIGVQVDLARVPASVVAVMTGSDLAAKTAALSSPATTVALVKAGAVVGVVDRSAPGDAAITRVGVTCALCHQLVTPTTFQLGGGPAALPIGNLVVNGAPNLAMDAGKILSLTAGVQGAGLADAMGGWGASKFDVRNPATANGALDDGANNPTLTPPLWNFVDLEAEQYPFGWDGLFFGTDALASQAEAVYHLVMGGQGAFAQPGGAIAPALRVTPPDRILSKLPGAVSATPLITADKLHDIQEWMRSMTSPAPGAFDAAQAEQGWRLFNTRGCTQCHKTAELAGDKDTIIPIAGSTGDLAGGVKTPSLRGLTAAGPPYFHDGRAASLASAVQVMNGQVGGTLSTTEQAAVVEYLKSL